MGKIFRRGIDFSGGGGGSTHIAKNTNRGLLKNYASYKSEILIVAGGGGGSFMGDSGGAGGWYGGGGGLTYHVNGSEDQVTLVV